MTNFELLVEATSAEQQYLLGAPIMQDLIDGAFDLAAYQAFLVNAYQHVRHTVPLMMSCAARLPERLEWLRPALVEYINEEQGHEQWILDDLEVCGADVAALRRQEPGFEVELLVSYVYDFIERHEPIGFFGMVHVLEGTSTSIATLTAQLIQDRLGLPDSAFRYLRSHGELDKEHVVFFEQLINQLEDSRDVAAVIHVARRVYRLYGDVIRSVPRLESRRAA